MCRKNKLMPLKDTEWKITWFIVVKKVYGFLKVTDIQTFYYNIFLVTI